MHILDNVINLAKSICIIKLFSDQSGQAHFLVDFSAKLSILSHAAWLMLNYLCFWSKYVSGRNFSLQLLFCDAELLSFISSSFWSCIISSYFDNERSEIIPHAILDKRIRYKEFLRLQLIQNPNLIVYRFCSAVNYD